MRKIAISDIHGCQKTFKALVEDQVVFSKDDSLYLLGDFVDRGPDSKGVLDYVMQLQEAGYDVHCLKGNHEEMMVEAARQTGDSEVWLFNGGRETLGSFQTSVPHQIEDKYIDFVDGMLPYLEVDKYILVHAGLNFNPDQHDEKPNNGFLWRMHNPFRYTKSMLWIRHWYETIDWNWLKDRVIIHGHTPIKTDEIWDMYDLLDEDQVLDIDNGCFAKYTVGMGQLCAFDMTYRQLYFQENLDSQ
ncbi:MAG: metallophosphoesterase family protein [Bacteroidota bacterium]